MPRVVAQVFIFPYLIPPKTRSTKCFLELVVVHVPTYKEGEKEPGYWDNIDSHTHKVFEYLSYRSPDSSLQPRCLLTSTGKKV
jgi:hypothetical protein